MPELVATYGIPASGKTKWASDYATKIDAVLISSDAIRTSRVDPIRHLKAMESEAEAHLLAGRSVVIDTCNTRKAQRIRWRNLAVRTRATPVIAVIATHPDICKARNALRPPSEQVPLDRMDSYVEDTRQPVDLHIEGWRVIGVTAPDRPAIGATTKW